MKHLGHSVIEKQRLLLLQEVSKHLSKGQEYIVVDFPTYSNVGDSAIWLGMTKLLRAVSGRRPTLAVGQEDLRNFALPDGPIFICGGGNFGDLWHKHQSYRYDLMKKYPHHQIIQMPQSIQFTNENKIKECRDAIKSHGNFHIMVRDKRSQNFVRNELETEAPLVPDCALFLGPLDVAADARFHETLYMLRKDTEKRSYDLIDLMETLPGPVWDWLDEPTSTTKKSIPSLILSALSGSYSRTAMKERHMEIVARRRFLRGQKMLGSAERIITDRLHVHIMCILMNIPHIALDNSYGKIHGYIDEWMNDCNLVCKANDGSGVLEQIASLPYINGGAWQFPSGAT